MHSCPPLSWSPFWPVWHYASAVLVMAWCLLAKIGVLSKRIELVFGMEHPSAYLILGYLQNKGNSCKLWTLQISPQHVDHRDTSIQPDKDGKLARQTRLSVVEPSRQYLQWSTISLSHLSNCLQPMPSCEFIYDSLHYVYTLPSVLGHCWASERASGL